MHVSVRVKEPRVKVTCLYLCVPAHPPPSPFHPYQPPPTYLAHPPRHPCAPFSSHGGAQAGCHSPGRRSGQTPCFSCFPRKTRSQKACISSTLGTTCQGAVPMNLLPRAHPLVAPRQPASTRQGAYKSRSMLPRNAAPKQPHRRTHV
jgi:hypothetical protein